jgi:hypothetical protein
MHNRPSSNQPTKQRHLLRESEYTTDRQATNKAASPLERELLRGKQSNLQICVISEGKATKQPRERATGDEAAYVERRLQNSERVADSPRCCRYYRDQPTTGCDRRIRIVSLCVTASTSLTGSIRRHQHAPDRSKQ